MKAMILAAGSGTRLYPLTFSLPKPMAPVLNRPVMEHILRHMTRHGFSDIIVNLHKMGESIEEYFGDGSRLGVKITYSYEPTPLGTAGGVKKVEHFFNETFMVIGGDDLTNIDLTDIIKFHRKKKALATIGLTSVKDVSNFGVVVTDEEGKIKDFQEKPKEGEAKSNWANNGIYIFEPEILKVIPKDTFYDFGSQLFPSLKNNGVRFYGCRCNGYWKDVGTLIDYRRAHVDCLLGKIGVQYPGREVLPGIWAEEGVEISVDAAVEGPVLLGKKCKIQSGAKIKGPVVMGKYNTIGKGAEVNHSVMWNYNYLKPNSRVKDCLVGSECIVPQDMVYEKTVLGSGMKDIFEDYFLHKRMKPHVHV